MWRKALRTMLVAMALGQVFTSATPAAERAPQAASPPAPASARVWVGRYAEFEEFLRIAEIERTTSVGTGILGIRRAHFKPGGLAASAALRSIQPGRYGGFFESYRSEIAAYRLDRLLELDMVPPTVERRHDGNWVSLQLWTENTKMLKEVEEQKLAFPSTLEWSRQLNRQRLFDDLVANIDENKGNLLFDAAWNIIKIDCSRCFTNALTQPFEVGRIVLRVDRPFFERLKALDRETLRREIGTYVEGGAVDVLLARRNDIVKRIERLVKDRGEAQVFLANAWVAAAAAVAGEVVDPADVVGGRH